MNECSFLLSHYKECLELAKQKGYKFLTMKDYVEKKESISETDKVIVMRHDIDFDPTLAMNFAKIEHELGISATYFIRIHGKYNPTNYENYKTIKELQKMGHELGLHYDCDFANMFNEEPEQFFERDKKIFENIIGTPILGISTHEPARSKFKVTDETITKHGLSYHGYSNTFLKEMKYVSDSGARWREGCMCNFIEKETPKLCILTHPFWWFKESPLENWC